MQTFVNAETVTKSQAIVISIVQGAFNIFVGCC